MSQKTDELNKWIGELHEKFLEEGFSKLRGGQLFVLLGHLVSEVERLENRVSSLEKGTKELGDRTAGLQRFGGHYPLDYNDGRTRST